MGAPDAERTLVVRPVRLAETLRFQRVGTYDPTARVEARTVVVAFRLRAPVVLALAQRDATTIDAKAWGPEAAEALALAPGIAGDLDDAESFAPEHHGLARLVRQHRGVRLPRVPWIFELLVSFVLQQRVAFQEAARAYRTLVANHGEPAPGPHGLRVLPSPRAMLGLRDYDFRAAFVDGKRETILREVARRADALATLRTAPPAEVRAALGVIPGIGPWTLESVMGWGLGDADACPTGDYWLPHGVTKAFTGEERGNDERMLALLEPFRPHRFRVLRLLAADGRDAPRHGPRKHTGLTPRRRS